MVLVVRSFILDMQKTIFIALALRDGQIGLGDSQRRRLERVWVVDGVGRLRCIQSFVTIPEVRLIHRDSTTLTMFATIP